MHYPNYSVTTGSGGWGMQAFYYYYYYYVSTLHSTVLSPIPFIFGRRLPGDEAPSNANCVCVFILNPKVSDYSPTARSAFFRGPSPSLNLFTGMQKYIWCLGPGECLHSFIHSNIYI